MNHLANALQTALQESKVDRRGFLTFAAKGLAIAFAMPIASRVAKAQAPTGPTGGQLASAYVHIGSDGSITLNFGGAEMGQGSMSGLSQILAEELMVDWNQITVQQTLVDPIVSYLTGGSSAISGRYATLRNAGAAARELLIAAAMQLQVGHDTNRDNYSAASAVVMHTPTNATWPYSALAGLAATLTPPTDLRLTDPSKFRLIGKSVPRVDIPSKVNGSAQYGIDKWLPNMVFAAIKHCPTLGGTLASTPAKPSGAIAVVACKAVDSRGKVVAGTVNAVAVVATDTWQAMRLANGLSVSWTLPASTSDVDSTQLASQAGTLMATGAALVAEPPPPTPTYTAATYAPVIEAVVNAALGTTPTRNRTYSLPFLAHATMEPLNCTVVPTVSGGVVQAIDIYAPTQAASWVVGYAHNLTNLPASAITVHTMLLGGGLGRKFEMDFIGQAVQVAMKVMKPVKLTWRREEDFTHDQYRPCALVKVQATLNSGLIGAWSVRTVTPSILAQRQWIAAGSVDGQAVEGAINLPYSLGTHLTEWVPLPSGIPLGFWRSVGSSINAFAVESMMDELAAAAGVDPFIFRYRHLTSGAAQRFYNVLHTADIMTSSWRNSQPTGHAWGVAIAESFGTIVCEVVDVSAPTTGTIKVNRVDCFIDCGTVINPNSVEAQMQSGIVHGINSALWGRTTFTSGKAIQQNFNNYRVMRIGEMPTVNVQIVQSTNAPSGTGEPAVPPLAPALANAYARLTGTRITVLPFFPTATMGGL